MALASSPGTLDCTSTTKADEFCPRMQGDPTSRPKPLTFGAHMSREARDSQCRQGHRQGKTQGVLSHGAPFKRVGAPKIQVVKERGIKAFVRAIIVIRAEVVRVIFGHPPKDWPMRRVQRLQLVSVNVRNPFAIVAILNDPSFHDIQFYVTESNSKSARQTCGIREFYSSIWNNCVPGFQDNF